MNNTSYRPVHSIDSLHDTQNLLSSPLLIIVAERARHIRALNKMPKYFTPSTTKEKLFLVNGTMASLQLDLSLLPASSKLRVNQNRGLFHSGKPLDTEKKLKVATAYKNHSAMVGGRRPVIAAVARETGVSRTTVMKIESELDKFGCIQTPKKERSSKALVRIHCHKMTWKSFSG